MGQRSKKGLRLPSDGIHEDCWLLGRKYCHRGGFDLVLERGCVYRKNRQQSVKSIRIVHLEIRPTVQRQLLKRYGKEREDDLLQRRHILRIIQRYEKAWLWIVHLP